MFEPDIGLKIYTLLCVSIEGPETVEYIWRETRSKLVQFIETFSNYDGIDMSRRDLAINSSQSREWLDFQSILISLLRTAFTSSTYRGALFQAMISVITPSVGSEEMGNSGSDGEDGHGGVEELNELDVWLFLALADTAQYKTKVHTCLIKQVLYHSYSLFRYNCLVI